MQIERYSVLVLSAPQNSRVITDAVCQEALNIVVDYAGQPVDVRWLRRGEAWEAHYGENETPELPLGIIRKRFFAAIGSLPIDLNILVGQCSRSARCAKLLVADMESTIIEEEMLDELAKLVGVGDEVQDITARAMDGEIDFATALRARVALFKGVGRDLLDDLSHRMQLMPGAQTLVATMKAQGAYCALVSGGFDHFSEIVARTVGFDEHRANRFGFVNGVLSGDVEEPIMGQNAKLESLVDLCQENQTDLPQAVAIGDGANDLTMLTAAGLGIAFRAKPIVTRQIPVCLHHSDLTGVLYLQGLRYDDFVIPTTE